MSNTDLHHCADAFNTDAFNYRHFLKMPVNTKSYMNRPTATDKLISGQPLTLKQLSSDLASAKTEDCFTKIKNVIQEAEIFSSDTIMYFDRAHRLGTKNKKKIRPIIVKFTYYRHKEFTFKNSFKFAGCNINVSEDFSRQTLAIHKTLIDHSRKAMIAMKNIRLETRYN